MQKSTNYKITFEQKYEGHKILANKDSAFGCNTQILEKSLKLMEDYTERHSRTLYLRFDVRYPKDNNTHSTTNKEFSGFMDSFNTHLKRKHFDPKYIWCREQSREKHQHYHVALLLDGSKTRNIHHHIKKAEELWSQKNDLNTSNNNNGLIHDCTKSRKNGEQKNGIMIKRNSPEFKEQFDKCFEWNSYLAKVNTKGYSPKNSKDFSCSQIKKVKK